MDGDAINNFAPQYTKTQKIRYRYVIRNFDPINPLKLKRYRWCGIRGYYLIQIH